MASSIAAFVSRPHIARGVLRIGLCGGGTVGGGVCDMLAARKDAFEALGCKVEVAKMLVRDPTKSRDFELPEGCEVVTDASDILDDESIDCVVELIGGTDLAKDITFGALNRGKHVVSANKALIAAHADDIVSALQSDPSLRFGYEAAVCGGIPIIKALQRDFIPDKVKRLSGVFNGTTNFILSSMELEGRSYTDVLKEAQELGFAEADPTADVGGYDARSKLCILSRLALGVNLDEESVPLTGIESITSDDFAYAQKLNCSIKLLGVVSTTSEEEGGGVSAAVSPMLVPMENSIAKIHGATNIVEVLSEGLERSFLIGEGAGRYPTANSVVSDIFGIASANMPSTIFPLTDEALTASFDPDFESTFYIRIQVKDELGIIRTTGALCEKHGISIHAVYQEPIRDSSNMPFVLATEPTRVSNIDALCDDLVNESFVLERPFSMPFLA